MRERKGWVDLPVEVAVREEHAEAVTDPAVEWMYEDTTDPVTGERQSAILMGVDLEELDEYILAAEPTEYVGPGGTGRVHSHEDHNGYRMPIVIRRRGSKDYKPITLVIPTDKLPRFVEFLKGMLPPTN